MWYNREGQTLWQRGGSHIVCVWQERQSSGATDKMILLWSVVPERTSGPVVFRPLCSSQTLSFTLTPLAFISIKSPISFFLSFLKGNYIKVYDKWVGWWCFRLLFWGFFTLRFTSPYSSLLHIGGWWAISTLINCKWEPFRKWPSQGFYKEKGKKINEWMLKKPPLGQIFFLIIQNFRKLNSL